MKDRKKRRKKKQSESEIKLAAEEPKTKHNLPSSKTLKSNIPFFDCHPIFCFEYFCINDSDFPLSDIRNIGEYHKIFEQLIKISSLKWYDILTADQFHCHPLDWRETTRKQGFSNLPPQCRNRPPYQFKLFKICRAIGFIDNAVFHLVWIDRFHKLVPRK